MTRGMTREMCFAIVLLTATLPGCGDDAGRPGGSSEATSGEESTADTSESSSDVESSTGTGGGVEPVGGVVVDGGETGVGPCESLLICMAQCPEHLVGADCAAACGTDLGVSPSDCGVVF